MTYSTLGVLSFSVSVVIEIESCDENFGQGPVSVTGNLGTYATGPVPNLTDYLPLSTGR